MVNRWLIKKYTCLDFAILVVLWLYSFGISSESVVPENWTMRISVVSWILLSYHLVRMIGMKIKYYDFRLVFICLQYVFIFGRIYLHALGLDTNIFWNLFLKYSEVAQYKAAVYGCLYSQAIFTGLFANTQDSLQVNDNSISRDTMNSGNKLAFVGFMLVLISFPFKFQNDMVAIAMQRAASGYVSITATNGMLYAIGMLLPVGVIYLVCSDTISKHLKRVVLVALIGYMAVVMIFSGDRRYAVTAMIAITFCLLRKYEVRLNLRKIIPVVILTMVLLMSLAAIRNGRGRTIATLSDFYQLLMSAFSESNMLYETLAEFGLTFFIYASAFQYVPEVVPYKLGITYVAAPLTIIPMSGLLFPDLQTSISAHMDLKQITGDPLGAALGQEIFCNFGYFSPIFAIIAGIIINKVMRMKSKMKSSELAKYYSLYYLLLNLVRSSTTEILRMAAYAVILPAILGVVYENIARRKGVR